MEATVVAVAELVAPEEVVEAGEMEETLAVAAVAELEPEHLLLVMGVLEVAVGTLTLGKHLDLVLLEEAAAGGQAPLGQADLLVAMELLG